MKIINFIYSKNIPMRIRNLTLSTFIALAIMTHQSVCPAPVAAGDTVHEEFEYTVYLAGFIAGKAVMTYDSTAESIKIRTRAMSTGIISLFYKIDDVSESILNPDGYPRSNMLKIRQEGKEEIKKLYLNDWKMAGRIRSHFAI